eukprot:jgi/Hompol1/3370/HPOL_006493-RA
MVVAHLLSLLRQTLPRFVAAALPPAGSLLLLQRRLRLRVASPYSHPHSHPFLHSHIQSRSLSLSLSADPTGLADTLRAVDAQSELQYEHRSPAARTLLSHFVSARPVALPVGAAVLPALHPDIARAVIFNALARAFHQALFGTAGPQPSPSSATTPLANAPAACEAATLPRRLSCDSLISMRLYSAPKHELRLLDSSSTQLTLDHIQEIRRIADDHFDHLTKVSVTLQKLVAAGVTGMKVTSGNAGDMQIQVVVPAALLNRFALEQQHDDNVDIVHLWLKSLGINPASSHFTIDTVKDSSLAQADDDLASFLSLLNVLDSQSTTMFTNKRTHSIRIQQQHNSDRLEAHKLFATSL